eukprot:Em0016g588a
MASDIAPPNAGAPVKRRHSIEWSLKTFLRGQSSTPQDTLKIVSKNRKAKSTKDKSRTVNPAQPFDLPPGTSFTISGTSRGLEGLYGKLVYHQKNIISHLTLIRTLLESGDAKKQLSPTATKLLEELNSSATTTSQCLTKDIYDKFEGLKSRMETSEKTMYGYVANLVRWIDARNPDPKQEDKDAVLACMENLKTALETIVNMVSDAQGGRSTLSATVKPRSNTLNEPMLKGSHVSTQSVHSESGSDSDDRRRSGSVELLDQPSDHAPVSPTRRPLPHASTVDMVSDITRLSSGRPTKGAATLPRPNSNLLHTHYGDEFSGVIDDDEPPPPPLPKKKSQTNSPGDSLSSTLEQVPLEDDEAPPPLPVKKRHAATPLGSPPVDQLAGVAGGEDCPPVPFRMHSIPQVKQAMDVAPPPKPPRRDQSDVLADTCIQRDQPVPLDQMVDTLERVKRFNAAVQRVQSGEEEAPPPVPLKKKTIDVYQTFLQNYTYNEALHQPLYIPEITAPPVPEKKRRRDKAAAHSANGTADHALRQGSGLDSQDTGDDVYKEEEEVVEVCYLECVDVSPYLKFNKEEDGGFTLRGGPVDALIAYAASTTNAVKHFSEAFLLTYYTFITPDELTTRLLKRLDYFYRSQNAAVWQPTASLLVRVLNGLNKPLQNEAEDLLVDMVHKMLSEGNLKFAQIIRNALVTKLNQLVPLEAKSVPYGLAFRSDNPRKSSILDFVPEKIAEQMTVLDNQHFQKVDVAEMLYWAKEQNEEKSPHLTEFTMHFNKVSQWTKTRLLDKTIDSRVRVKLMMQFIAIMRSLREAYNNFNSYLAILSAIESSAISRLEWPEKVIKGLEEPRTLIDNRGSFKNYREAFAQAKPPCIPYIGLYLQDLTFIEMQPSLLEDKTSINFTKKWKQFKSVDHIRFSQTKQYTFHPDPEVLSMFGNFEQTLTDEELWQVSNEIKPRSQKTVAQ